MEEERKNEIIEQMLNMLAKETEQKLPEGLSDKQKYELLKCLMLIRPAGYLDDGFLKIQDELLRFENSKITEEISKLKFTHNTCEIQTEILNLNADLIVVFSSNLISSGVVDNSLDNQLVLKGGLQIKEDICSLFESRRNLILSEPFIVKAYNLPSRYIAKIVVSANTKNKQEYLNRVFEKIFIFVKEEKIKSVAIDFKNLLNLLKIDEKTLKNQLKSQLKTKKIKIKLVFVD